MVSDPIQFESVQLQTQSHCNCDCVICPYGSVRRTLKQGRMEWPLFTRIVDDLTGYPALKSVALMLQNEPLLDSRLEDQLEYVRSKRDDLRLTLATNGALLTRERTRRLTEAGLGSLTFSVNAFTAETFGEIHRGIDFNRVMENLQHLVELKEAGLALRVRIKFLVFQENLFELAAADRRSGVLKRIRQQKIPLVVEPISNRAGSLPGYEELVAMGQFQSSHKKTRCRDPWATVNVLFNGDVIACCADWARSSVMGNLGQEPYREIWNSSRARAFRDTIRQGNYGEQAPCRSCSQAWNIMRSTAGHLR